MTTPDLLVLRLDALEQDIVKVANALERALERGHDLEEARRHFAGARKTWNEIEEKLRTLAARMEDEPTIARELDDVQSNLARDLRAVATEKADALGKQLLKLRDDLDGATVTAVQLEDRHLQSSLERRCTSLVKAIDTLREKVANSPVTKRKKHWEKYQELLDGEARPIFAEYVDFFAGLTLRDTGLDDRVCEMTDAVLKRFRKATGRSLPLPARQAALGVALHSVVLLGFPEWSIWGIPLVGHEVGLAYAEERKDEPEVADLITRFAPEGASHSAQYVRQLFADVFATYTAGLSYACAAMLLRLSPRHGKDFDPDNPTDIDRAHVILMTLRESDEGGGSFTEAVEHLRETWLGAVRAHAGPADAERAEREAKGRPPERDWRDNFTQAAIEYLREIPNVVPAYDRERWEASSQWAAALYRGDDGPGWLPEKDAVPDVLTAAWRLRMGWAPVLEPGSSVVRGWTLDGDLAAASTSGLALKVKDRWSLHRKAAGR